MTGKAALRGLHLHVDCASGAAGDMLLAALIDLRVPLDATGDAHGDKTEEVLEHGNHDHGNGAHAHVHYADIRARIQSAPLAEGTRLLALDIFDRLARAEAKLHGTSVADVVFHEVGAVDSIVDVVATAAALDWLRPVSLSCAAVAMGHGTLHCAPGVLPVPAPAALEVLR